MKSVYMNFTAAVLTAAVVFGVGLQVSSAEEKKTSILPSKDRALMIAQSGDQVTLQWNSEKGKCYTLLYTDEQYSEQAQGCAVWSVLPGYERMPGTGRQETRVFKTDPTRPRRYNLRVETEEQVRKARASSKKR